jgi:transmembrane sensor
MRSSDEIQAGVRTAEEAARWFARLQGDASTGEDWLAFERWLGASPAHVRAYEQLERLWVDLDYAPVARDLGGRPLLAARRRSSSRRGRPNPGRTAWLGAGAAVAASLLVAVAVGLHAPPTAVQILRTAPGEIRQVTLADGSRIRLNAASQITVSLGRDARRVRMGDAEAAFDVAHDARRPFLIAVGDRQVRVVGTEFNLRHRDDVVDLTVRRGTVEVRPTDAPQASPTRVTVGQELTHVEGGGQVLKASDPQAAFAWINGQLIYRDRPLSDVAADLSRRFATPVRTADARTAALRFTGVLVTDNEADVLRRLEAFAPVRAERTPGGIVLHRR